MSKANNIDRLFRNNLSETEHAFNENAWADMEEMLDANSVTSNSFWYKMSGSTFVFVLVTSLASFLSINPENAYKHNSLGYEKSSMSLNENFKKPVANETIALNSEVTKTTQNRTLNNGSTNSSRWIERLELVEIKKAIVNNAINSQLDIVNSEISQESTAPTSTNVDVVYDDYSEVEEFFVSAPQDPVKASDISNKKHSISVIASNTFNKGISNKTGIFGRNFLHTLGFEYALELNNNFKVVSGLLIRSRAGEGNTRQYNSEEYGFGKTATKTNVTTRSLQYIEMPILVDYSFGRKHHVFGGANIAVLTGVKNHIAKTTNETLSGQTSQSELKWGMESFYNPLNISLSAGYDYEISSKLKIGVNAQFGLTDYTNNNKWNNTQGNFHQEVQVSLKYNLFQF